MHKRSVFAGAIALTMVGLLLLSWPAHPGPRSPVLSLVSIEPAGIWDDAGAEMWMVTLSVSNSQISSSSDLWVEYSVWVKYSARSFEARVAGRWTGMDVDPWTNSLGPGNRHQVLLLMPAATDSCRVGLKYTGSRLTGGRLAWLAERLPPFIRFRLSHKFWRWVRFPQYGPSSHWRGANLELPLRPPPAPPPINPAAARDPRPAATALLPIGLPGGLG